jgi:dTDP-4-amino-4,6-dideoxygalactose transaminase/glycosyltransferase involved in cell wall biosynthesis
VRLGYVVSNFPPLSETFIRREVVALCDVGHSVCVYTNCIDRDPLVIPPQHPRLEVREVRFTKSLNALVEVVRKDAIDHLHGTLMSAAQQAAAAAASEIGLPFSITAYSGYTVFTAREPIFAAMSANPLCRAIVVEDEFMRDWVTTRLGAVPEKVVVIPNSIDMALYRPPHNRRPRATSPRILAIARFVEKKGLADLIEAFRRLRGKREAELHLIGRGPEEETLRGVATGVPDIHFLGAQPETKCREAYASADIFASPCIRASDGDADGIPTTVLEAMACGLPVVVSDLFSAGCYVRDGIEGLLIPPGDPTQLESALAALCDDAGLRERLGSNARRQVEALCSLDRNVEKLQEIFRGTECNARASEEIMADNIPLVSIAVTTYNRASLVTEAIQSVLRQTYSRTEIVVVDDGSTDDTARVLSRFDGRLRVLRHEKNQGIAASKNTALRGTSESARYVGVLDSDDQYDPRFVERCVQFLETHPEIGLVYVNDVLFDARGQRCPVRNNSDPWSTEEWLRTCHLKGDGWLARRDIVMATDLHDERMPMDVDYDLFYQLLERTSFAHLPEPLLCIRQHADRQTNDALTLARCHAANLVKYGYSPEYAYLRARRHADWVPAIEEGIALGKKMRVSRERRKSIRSSTPERLAIDGGRPVRSEFLRFGAPTLGSEELEEITATLSSGWIGPGPRAERFENEFAQYVGAPYAVALSSCTAGLFLNLIAAGVGRNKEVITTSLTFAATANVIEHVGATPIFADIDPETLNIDPLSVKERISRRTAAIIPVHFGGLPCDLTAIEEIATARGVPVIEDAAHAVGARINGKMIGAGEHPAVFSFYANKNLTTGEGGMVTTRDQSLANRLRLLRSHGLDAGPWERLAGRRSKPFDVIAAGFKCSMPDIAAAIGLRQLKRQEPWLATRQEYAARYDEAFRELPVKMQKRPAAGNETRSSLHLYVLQLDPARWSVSRDDVVAALQAENIGAAVHYPPLHLTTYYRERYGFSAGMLPHAESAGATILTLPLSPGMTRWDVDDVIDAMLKVAAAYVI